MKTYKRWTAAIPFLFACLIAASFTTGVSADVLAQLSSRESYVGMPLTMYIQVEGNGSSEVPTFPEIDGLKIEQAGAPSRSSQVSIINGRRTERNSVTYAYRITPRRKGTFQIPSIEIRTGTKTERTRPLSFSATTSETGDLMFAEVTGQQEKTFVGQPIDLTLKIWVKPYVDQEREIKLSAQNIWQTISGQQTQWGGFSDTIENLANNPEAIRVSEVLKFDQDGIERSYYLYEISSTLYPKAAGALPADDIQIVAQYPTALGRSRDPFESFFGNSPFSNDDFFGRRGFSPFGSSLSVTASRPIIAKPDVSSVNVSPIPTENRPADYRGAVGQYVIATQASPTAVKAGDPIDVNIGIRGTGPMELVQAPPLGQLGSITNDFKVPNEPLAGVVQDDVKVFTTKLRPRNQSVTQIPAIPFSFFDPNEEKFITVYSDPIEIQVDKADQLSMDSIVGIGGVKAAQDDSEKPRESKVSLDNYTETSILETSSESEGLGGWFWLMGVPPLMFVFFWIFNQRIGTRHQRGKRTTLQQIDTANNAGTIAEAVQRFSRCNPQGLPKELEMKLERLYDDCNNSAFAGGATSSLEEFKEQARHLIKSLDRATVKGKTNWIIPNHPIPSRVTVAGIGCAALMILMGYTLSLTSSNGFQKTTDYGATPLQITPSQQATLLEEATLAYQTGRQLTDLDTAEAKQAFAKATDKYQSLVDSGINNSQVFFNLGNACLQNDSVGRAIANYHRAIELNPFDFQSRHNLHRAQTLAQPESDESVASIYAWIQKTFTAVANGVSSISGPFLAMTWFCFWILLTFAIFRPVWKMKTLTVVTATALLILCGTIVADHHNNQGKTVAVIIADDVALHAGNGESFAELPGNGLSEGTSVQVIQKRGNWLQIRSPEGVEGWIQSDDLEVV